MCLAYFLQLHLSNSHGELQVKKFGNPSQIDLIVDDVGGAMAKAPCEAQIELYDLLIDGCQEAVKENTDIKVYFIVMPLRENGPPSDPYVVVSLCVIFLY